MSSWTNQDQKEGATSQVWNSTIVTWNSSIYEWDGQLAPAWSNQTEN